jgi:hypothetical protein
MSFEYLELEPGTYHILIWLFLCEIMTDPRCVLVHCACADFGRFDGFGVLRARLVVSRYLSLHRNAYLCILAGSWTLLCSKMSGRRWSAKNTIAQEV